MGRFALERCAAYTQSRRQFGEPIASFALGAATGWLLAH
jgi:alkylation response protein AidB-like acyl-CoA dehydrogenase